LSADDGSVSYSSFSSSSSTNSLLQNTETAYLNQLNQMIYQRKQQLPNRFEDCYRIKQSPVDLAATLWTGNDVVKQFVKGRLFKHLYKNKKEVIIKFWTSFDLVEGDWLGLTRVFLAKAFSAEFLTPLRDSDTSVKLSVNDAASVTNFLKMVKHGEMRDSLDDAKLVNAAVSSVHKFTPRIPFIGKYDCNFGDRTSFQTVAANFETPDKINVKEMLAFPYNMLLTQDFELEEKEEEGLDDQETIDEEEEHEDEDEEKEVDEDDDEEEIEKEMDEEERAAKVSDSLFYKLIWNFTTSEDF